MGPFCNLVTGERNSFVRFIVVTKSWLCWRDLMIARFLNADSLIGDGGFFLGPRGWLDAGGLWEETLSRRLAFTESSYGHRLSVRDIEHKA
jgi:hypothetical protein